MQSSWGYGPLSFSGISSVSCWEVETYDKIGRPTTRTAGGRGGGGFGLENQIRRMALSFRLGLKEPPSTLNCWYL